MLVRLSVNVLMQIFSVFLDLLTAKHLSAAQKDLEIVLLRQQVRILQRKHPTPPRVSHWDKCALAILTARFRVVAKGVSMRLDEVLLLFKPDTVLKWHRELVRRKWTYKKTGPRGSRGRRPIACELEELIVRLATENPRWGYGKIQGELIKLGYSIGRSTVQDLLRRKHIPPAHRRSKAGTNWRTFLGHYGNQILACDFFTVETIRLQTVYVLFFIQIGTRRVHFAGCTPHPTGEWVSQQARNLSWDLLDIQDKQNGEQPRRFLIHDRDAKFTHSFDTVFATQGTEIIRTPYRAPKANAFAERWVRTVRDECLDQVLIISEGHLRRVLIEYTEYYNEARAHQGIEQRIPMRISERRVEEEKEGEGHAKQGAVHRREVLGGIIHDYYWIDTLAA